MAAGFIIKLEDGHARDMAHVHNGPGLFKGRKEMDIFILFCDYLK